ncbi:MAG: hypothetical protein IID36_13175 [Planctomycetes bacterium]|nr:hypothetical protein [Planctomycetota bacterium]
MHPRLSSPPHFAGQSFARDRTFVYNELGLTTSDVVDTNEHGATPDRGFTYDADLAAGQYTRTGPDGVETFATLDDAGRLATLRRGPSGTPVMTATYTYWRNDLVDKVTYGNTTSVDYSYDAAGQVTRIEYSAAVGGVYFALDYTYTATGLPATIIETNPSPVAVATFTYDERSRLIGEIRVGTNPYDLAYTYDPGGNRLTKLDGNNDLLVEYEYDYTDPATYGSDNNRLMFYETFDTSGPQNVLLETTWYFYNAAGNPTRIVTSAAGSNDYSATLFSYARNGSTVSFVLGETWTDTGACRNRPTS